MKQHTVLVGAETYNNGTEVDRTMEVKFSGQIIVDFTETTNGDSRGQTYKLYRLMEEGKEVYLLHIADWTRYQGETSFYRLEEVTLDELRTDYFPVAKKAGLLEPLTWKEAVEYCRTSMGENA